MQNKKVITRFTVQYGIHLDSYTAWKVILDEPLWLFKLCTRPNIFPYCTVKRLIYNYLKFTNSSVHSTNMSNVVKPRNGVPTTVNDFTVVVQIMQSTMPLSRCLCHGLTTNGPDFMRLILNVVVIFSKFWHLPGVGRVHLHVHHSVLISAAFFTLLPLSRCFRYLMTSWLDWLSFFSFCQKQPSRIPMSVSAMLCYNIMCKSENISPSQYYFGLDLTSSCFIFIRDWLF